MTLLNNVLEKRREVAESDKNLTISTNARQNPKIALMRYAISHLRAREPKTVFLLSMFFVFNLLDYI